MADQIPPTTPSTVTTQSAPAATAPLPTVNVQTIAPPPLNTTPSRTGLLDIKVSMSTPNPTAGTQFTVYLLVTNLFDVPIWPQSPQVFLPNELEVIRANALTQDAIKTLDVLVKRAAAGEIPPRADLKDPGPTFLQRICPTFFKYQPPPIRVEDVLKQLAGHSQQLDKRLCDLEAQRDELQTGISVDTQLTVAGQTADTQKKLTQLSAIMREISAVRAQIDTLRDQIVTLTGSSAVISETNLELENFTFNGPLYVRAKGNVRLNNPTKAQVVALDSSLQAGLPLQPGNTAVYSLSLKTREEVFFRPSQYSLQYSINFSFDQKLTTVHTNTTNQVLNVRASIGAIMLGSVIGGASGYLARCVQHAANKVDPTQGFSSPTLYYLSSGILTIILSAMAIVFLARKSDTQQMVSIEDFWGGIVIGFLVGYTGTSAFENLARINGGKPA